MEGLHFLDLKRYLLSIGDWIQSLIRMSELAVNRGAQPVPLLQYKRGFIASLVTPSQAFYLFFSALQDFVILTTLACKWSCLGRRACILA